MSDDSIDLDSSSDADAVEEILSFGRAIVAAMSGAGSAGNESDEAGEDVDELSVVLTQSGSDSRSLVARLVDALLDSDEPLPVERRDKLLGAVDRGLSGLAVRSTVVERLSEVAGLAEGDDDLLHLQAALDPSVRDKPPLPDAAGVVAAAELAEIADEELMAALEATIMSEPVYAGDQSLLNRLAGTLTQRAADDEERR